MPGRSRQALLAQARGQKASVSEAFGQSRRFGVRPGTHKATRRPDIMTERAYLDWNATAPLRPQARAAMAAAVEVVGNPSSVHAEGRAARQILETARERVAAAVGAKPRDVIFTSGGSEAN